MMVGVVAGWLGGAAISDAYTRAVNAMKPDETKRLRQRVESDTGLSFPARRYGSWYNRESTWRALCLRSEAGYEALRASLHDELWGRPLLLRRAPDASDQERLVQALLDATIGHFMQNLEPSVAVTVHDAREAVRHQEVLESIEGRGRLDERLRALPPAARDHLTVLRDRNDPQLLKVLDVMEQGVDEPARALRSLLDPPVTWVNDLSTAALVALAEYAVAHGAASEASLLFERAADTGGRRGWCLARASIHASAAGQADSAATYAGMAEDVDPQDRLVQVVSAVVTEDTQKILERLDGTDTGDDYLLTSLVAAALANAGRADEALALLRASVAGHPDWTGHDILAATLLVNRVLARRSPSRDADLSEAIERAVRARDLRRSWRGLSAEAVVAACTAAAIAHDHEQVVRLSTANPAGEATETEAVDKEVRSFAARGWLARGDVVEAERLARLSDDLYLQELIAAKVALLRGADGVEDGRGHVAKAWELATSDDDRFDVQVTASALGVVPVPGLDELRADMPDFAALLEAQGDYIQGRLQVVITKMRPYAGRVEQCAVLLAQAYFDLDMLHEAVAELRRAAERFDQSHLLLTAASCLIRRGSDDQACDAEARELVQECLARLGPTSPLRLQARRLLLQISQRQRDWPEMETQARTVLSEQGSIPEFRWVLVGALFNQGRHLEAWQASCSDGPLEPDDADRAALWAQLNCRHDPSPETVIKACDLLERHLDDEQNALVIARSLLLHPDRDDPGEEVKARWNEALTAFLRRYPDHPALHVIHFDENFDQLFEYLRNTLEPTHAASQDALKQVREGAVPYGIVSALGGRPYAAAFLYRAAGCLPMYSPDLNLARLERHDARAAMGTAVVVDPTVVIVATFTDGLWTRLLSSFAALLVTDAAMRDLIGTREYSSHGDGMSMDWNADLGRSIVHQVEPEVLAEVRRRAELAEDWAKNDTRVVTWASQQAFGLGGEPPVRLENEPRFWAWVSGLDYAKANGLPFVCDDAVLRALARSEGVATFGTAAIIEALEESGELGEDERAAIFDRWRSEFCVDLPDADSLLTFARGVDFEPGPAALTMSRPAFWQNGPGALSCYRRLCKEAATTAPEQVPAWLWAAIVGVSARRPPTDAPRFAADLLLQTTALANPSPALFAQLVASAREALRQTGGELVLADVLRSLIGALAPLGPIGPQYVLTLGQDLPTEDREMVRRIAFNIG